MAFHRCRCGRFRISICKHLEANKFNIKRWESHRIVYFVIKIFDKYLIKFLRVFPKLDPLPLLITYFVPVIFLIIAVGIWIWFMT